MPVYVIAEAATTWRYGDELETVQRSIQAAKACGADAWKTQWTSDPGAMAKRRGVTTDYSRLAWSASDHRVLATMCAHVGIDYMCTVYLCEDVLAVAPFVARLKISAYESQWDEFVRVNARAAAPLIVSLNPYQTRSWGWDARYLHCVSEYPTAPEHAHLALVGELDGLSDHTTSLISGAVAVGCGAKIVEKHMRLSDTSATDPDYAHSLDSEGLHCDFGWYVRNIREAERMM